MPKQTILLAAVNAKYIHSNPAVYSLSRYAGGEAAGVSIVERTINDRYEDILASILERRPRMIGFSVYIWNAEIMRYLMSDIHRIDPSIVLFAGGPEATNAPATYLQLCDFLLLGEGEINFRRITEWVAAVSPELAPGEKLPVAQIPFEEMEGVAWKSAGCAAVDAGCAAVDAGCAAVDAGYAAGGGCAAVDAGCAAVDAGYAAGGGCICVREPGAKSAAPMDAIPFLYDDLAPFENRIIYYESARGCPFHCSYCLSSLERTVRFRNMETVLSELQFFLDHKVKQVKFVDRTFNVSHERAMTIWSYVRDHDNGMTNFHFEIGADLLNEEEIALLATLRPGLVQLEIGIQSTNETTMKVIHRSCDNAQLFRNVAELREPGNINLHTDLIAGLPYEDMASFEKSFNDIYPLMADQLQLGFLKVLAGTEMAARAEEFGLVYSSKQPYEIFSTKWISYEEISLLHDVTDAVEMFYNSRQFRYTLQYLVGWFESPFAMFRWIAGYMKQQFGAGVGVAARKRYEVLKACMERYAVEGSARGGSAVEGSAAALDPAAEGKVAAAALDLAAEGKVAAVALNPAAEGKVAVAALNPAALDTLDAYLKFDYALHFHQSRRMEYEDSFAFPEGEKRIRFDYTRVDPVTGECAWREV